ncbi:hypothetical protein SE15_04230 [Thermanaerothrix daxensis]|uniref:POTRA domain-containing protein n=1 Tax=Thermanaerothrix daxensis TaxID=869279 RepID=A0A0P6XNQ1_9CHLR|nr:FtsQ-type POTRA domain-containing protein [Thermanaerothrix daxensis]KPL84339.1 hypothetical protein SE15_04230 [Thermanaerothrix daxensis]
MKGSEKTTPSRADLVRQRRAQTTQQRIQRAKQSVMRREHRPTVIARGMVVPSASPTRPLPTSKVRRQYYFTLGVSGAELRMPAIPLVNPGWRLLSGMIAILMTLILYTLFNAPTFRVQRIEAIGLQRLTPADLQAVLEITDKPAVTLDLQTLKTQLEAAFPELKNIRLRLLFPARLVLTAVERQPALAWQVNGDTYWIDPEGVILRPRGEAGELPLVTANALPPLMNDSKGARASLNPPEVWGNHTEAKFVQAILNLRQRLSSDIPLVYDGEIGFGWQDPNGWQVLLGNTLDDFEAKMELYQIITEQIQKRGLHPQVISLEYLQAPFYK